jgi:hypothetical protein
MGSQPVASGGRGGASSDRQFLFSGGRVQAAQIGGLVTLNLITQTEAEILHDLRFMANKAAHEVKAHSTQELNLAFDVVEHLPESGIQAKRLPVHQEDGTPRKMSADVRPTCGVLLQVLGSVTSGLFVAKSRKHSLTSGTGGSECNLPDFNNHGKLAT